MEIVKETSSKEDISNVSDKVAGESSSSKCLIDGAIFYSRFSDLVISITRVHREAKMSKIINIGLTWISFLNSTQF